MAYTVLTTGASFGSEPQMTVKLEYEKQRSGASMQYRFRISLNPLNTSASYFGYWIKCDISLDSVAKQTGLQLKGISPYNWMTAIVTETGWYTVNNKTSGSTSFTFKIYGQDGRNYTYSYNLAIDPAASIISAGDGTLGSALTISITRYNSGYTHRLYYSCGSLVKQSIATDVGTSYSWTSSVNLSAQNVTGSSVSVTLICDTYSGSAYMGSTSKTVTMAIPASVVPSVSFASVTDPQGYKARYGSYVQSLSKLAISLSASGAQGSTIKSYNIRIGSLWTYSASSVTTPELPNAGSLTLTAMVTDSRGRTATVTSAITVTAYAIPAIPTCTARRCNAQGTLQDDSSYCKVDFTAAITPLDNQNSANYKVRYRAQGSELWTDIDVTASAGSYNPTTSVIFSANPDSAFEVCITATDDITTSTSSILFVSIAFSLMQATADGTGLAIGERATESHKFNVNLLSVFKKALGIGATPSSGEALRVSGGTAHFEDGIQLGDYPFDIIDNLTSTSTTDALSANQGKVLKGMVDTIGTYYQTTPANKSISVSTRTTIATLTLPAGNYVVSGFHAWTAGFSDNTIDYISVNGSSYMYNRAKGENGGGNVVTAVMSLTAQSTITLQTYLYGSTARTASSIKLVAIRI